jgi:uncharacterized protein (TIGR02231 family)
VIPIVRVTVLEDRAAITRRGTVALPAGQHRVVIERVAPALADKTLTAVATGARVLDVRCERSMAPWRDPAAASDDEPSALRAERTRLETARDHARAQLAAARAELAALAEVAAAALRDLAAAAGRAEPTDDALAQLAALDAHDAEARGRRVAAELAERDAHAALVRLDHRLTRAEAEAGEQVARLVIDVVADAAGDAELTVGYVVPGAAWRPYHRATLEGDHVAWETTACVWQATGEAWRDVELVCSLERASLGVQPPSLADDELGARRRPDQVVVEAREHELHTAGHGSAGPAEVPGIDDGGLGLTLTARRASVACDGAPHRVPVGAFRSPAKLERVAIPLRSPWVHLRAHLVNHGSAPLLAGPVDLVRASGYVGRAEIGFTAVHEQVQLGFGLDADVRIHRDEQRERDDAGLLGGWNVQTVRIAVRLSNLGGERREVVVTERVPVSEVEQVEVKPAAPDAYKLDEPGVPLVTARAIDDRGLVTWTVDLPPHGRRAVTLEYRIRSQRGVAVD